MDPDAETSNVEPDKNNTKPKLPGSSEQTSSTSSQDSSALDLSTLDLSNQSPPIVPNVPLVTSTTPFVSLKTVIKSSTLMEPFVNDVIAKTRKLLDIFDVNCWFKLSGKFDWVRWDTQLNRGLYCIDQHLPLILHGELVKPIDLDDDDSGMFGLTTAQKEFAVYHAYGTTTPLAYLSYNAHIERHIREWEDLDRIGEMLIKRALAPNALAWLGKDIHGMLPQTWNDLRPGQIESACGFVSRFQWFKRAYEIEDGGVGVQPMIVFHIFTKAILVRPDFVASVERLDFEGEPDMDKIYAEFVLLHDHGTHLCT
ncbi:hypothetical protein N7466_009822 [Penicillium verhagenii]|uniref:uncharacterized protein n=1 Tax=Penicillium verhagenii TaxID=1562060 RepID=UPI002545591B|nr:uncharacterized protein N7466_009822 [Penicillium verhagenii]KAJ5921496.1 hypothetical protein N7466_009822 [Penicillium verhagenii]